MHITGASSSSSTRTPAGSAPPRADAPAAEAAPARVDAFDGRVESEADRNRRVVDGFYAAFERKDGAGMSAAYAPDAVFSDPVFPNLTNGKGAAMWRMLAKSEDLKVRHEIVKVDGDTVTAKWIANYEFAGRPIENHVTSTLKLKDGKIVDHRDTFDMSKWLQQAYGFAAKLPFAEGVLGALTRHVAGNKLDSFIANET